MRLGGYGSEDEALPVSVPLPGFSGLRHNPDIVVWVVVKKVSVPLPGFSGLRLETRPGNFITA